MVGTLLLVEGVLHIPDELVRHFLLHSLLVEDTDVELVRAANLELRPSDPLLDLLLGLRAAALEPATECLQAGRRKENRVYLDFPVDDLGVIAGGKDPVHIELDDHVLAVLEQTDELISRRPVHLIHEIVGFEEEVSPRQALEVQGGNEVIIDPVLFPDAPVATRVRHEASQGRTQLSKNQTQDRPFSTTTRASKEEQTSQLHTMTSVPRGAADWPQDY